MTDISQYFDDIDTDAIEASSGRPDPVPTGDYLVEMTSNEVKETKDRTGILLNCQYKILDGEYENRVLFNSFNIRNKSPQAQTIGIAQLKGFCAAAGVSFDEAKNDISMLLHMPLTVKVGMSKTTTEYPDARNEIKAFRTAGGAPPIGKPAPLARPAVAAAPAASKSLPWKKNAA